MKTWWVLLICLLILALAVWAFISQIVLKKPFGNNSASDWMIYSMFGLALLINVLIFSIRMRLQVNKDGISIRYFPFINKNFKWNDVAEYEVLTYNPVKDYGGWGLRYNWKKKGKAYTVSGSYGLSLTLQEGKKVLIGTDKPEELKVFLEENKFKN